MTLKRHPTEKVPNRAKTPVNPAERERRKVQHLWFSRKRPSREEKKI